MLNQSYLGKYNFLFVVLDSCRWDSYREAKTPNLDKFGAAHKVRAPGYFTLPSHIAMFRGFMPSWPTEKGYYNRGEFVIFRLGGAARLGLEWPKKIPCGISFKKGEDIIEGFRLADYQTIGTGGVQWFDPKHPTSHCLVKNFEFYWYNERLSGFPNPDSIDEQIKKTAEFIAVDNRKKFVFLNSALTHHPYSYGHYVKKIPDNDRRAQIASAERFDQAVPKLLAIMPRPTFVIFTSDHGDCFGEDGLWLHPMDHPVLHLVPMLVFEVNG